MKSWIKVLTGGRGPAFAAVLFAALLPVGASAQTFSITVMPDPQYYTTSNHPTRFDLYNKQANWLKDYKNAYDIRHVLWVGDLTNDNTMGQWNTAKAAYDILYNNNVPFAVVPGNHDYKTPTGWPGANFRDLTRFNNVLGPQRFRLKPWYGGNMGETLNQNENNYTYFTGGGMDFLAIGLEYAPRKEVLTWANNLISQHPNHRVILFTHGYMTTNGNYVGNAGSSAGWVGATGAEIYDELVSRHSNIFMIVCGHVTESVVNTRTGVGGNRLYEMLVDYQGEKIQGTGANLGNGWFRLLQFNPSTNKIIASTITVAPGDTDIFKDGITKLYMTSRYGSDPRSADHLFSLDYDMGPLPPYTYLNASVGFHSMSVGGDLRADQQDPDIGQADNGNWVSTWEDDADDNGIFQVYVRGFDPDGNERFPKTLVNTLGVNILDAVNPKIAMAPDGRFAVVWQMGTTAIKMRIFGADGKPLGTSEQTIAQAFAPGSVMDPDVAMDDEGNFMVTWADDTDGDNNYDIKARGFTRTYAQRVPVKTVNNPSSPGNKIKPAIAMNGAGNYVIVWQDDAGGNWDVGMRGFNADETDLFPETLANTTVVGEQLAPDIAMNDAGQFVVIWEDDADLNQAYQIHARGFNPSGTQAFGSMTVNRIATGNQIAPAVDIDKNGLWYAVWQDNGVGGRGYQMMTNVFTMNGTRVNSSDVRANPVTDVTHVFSTPARKQPVISAHNSGRYIVSWADDMDGNDAYQALARGMAGRALSLVVKSVGGTVTKSPDQPFFAPGEVVTLTATPDPGYTFQGWSGDVSPGHTANTVNIPMNAKKSITAEFVPNNSTVDDWGLY